MSPHQPIATHRYTLTRRDALAFETGRPLGRVGEVLFVVWLALSPFETGLIAGDWSESWAIWALGAVLLAAHFALAKAVVAILAHRRAARRVPADMAMELEEWGDHLVIRGGGREVVLALEGIAATALTPVHLIISAPPETVIVPRSAFINPTDGPALQARIEAAGRDD